MDILEKETKNILNGIGELVKGKPVKDMTLDERMQAADTVDEVLSDFFWVWKKSFLNDIQDYVHVYGRLKVLSKLLGESFN